MHTISTLRAVMRALSVFGLWGWLDLFGAMLVAVGCAGELWILLNKLPKHVKAGDQKLGASWRILLSLDGKIRPVLARLKIVGWKLASLKERLLERLFVTIVALGVGLELIALPSSLWEAAQIGKQAADANVRAAGLKKQVEELRKANLELEAKIQPRRITPEQKDAIVAALYNWRFIKDKCGVKITVQPTDIEAKIFAEQIGDVLGTAFMCTTDEGLNATFPSAFGTKFSVHDPLPQGAGAIARALDSLPINPVIVDMNSNVPDGILFIEVYPKAIR